MDTILLVDDEKYIRRGLHALIEKSGVPHKKIIECANGLEALSAVKNERIHLAITDIRMSQMGGLDFLHAARTIDPDIRVVVISGYDSFNYAVTAMREGARDYLLKPVNRNAFFRLLQTIEEEIRQKETATEAQRMQDYQKDVEMLKYALLNFREETGASEMGLDLPVLQSGYHVCAFRTRLPDSALRMPADDAMVLRDMPQIDVAVVSQEAKDGFLKKAGGFVAVSDAQTRADALFQAYRQAVSRFKTAYYGFPPEAAAEEDACGFYTPETLGRFVLLLNTAHTDQIRSILETAFGKETLRKTPPEKTEDFWGNFNEAVLRIYSQVPGIRSALMPQCGDMYRFPGVGDFAAFIRAYAAALNRFLCDSTRKNAGQDIVTQAIDFIHRYYAQDITMAVVANAFSVNYSYFSQIFTRYTKLHFTEYLRNYRIDRSKELLASSDKKINAIANEVGFCDEKQYMKMFKCKVGVSPTEYRKTKVLCKCGQ